MNNIKERITQALHRFPAELVATLRPPAAPGDLNTLEQALGIVLPPALREALLCHDGQSVADPEMFGDYWWLSAKGMLSEWRVEQDLLESGAFDELNLGDLGDAVRQDWWNAKWIPFARSGSGDLLCVDMQPGRIGKEGQVITVYQEDETRPALADDFVAYLESLST